MSQNQTIICQVCKGWGHTPVPLKGDPEFCPNCNGESVQIQTADSLIFWDMPNFYDYQGYTNSRITRMVLLAILFGSLLLTLVFLVSAGMQAISQI